LFQRVRQVVSGLLSEALADWKVERTARVDDRWYRAAPAILDLHGHRPLLEAWFRAEEPTQQWEHMLDEEFREDAETLFVEHVREFQEFLQERRPLGKQAADLADVLARIALAGPATVSLWAMLRVAEPEGVEDRLAFLAGAARAGLGFRSLLNQPLSISTRNQVFKSGAYWAKVLKYAQAGEGHGRVRPCAQREPGVDGPRAGRAGGEDRRGHRHRDLPAHPVAGFRREESGRSGRRGWTSTSTATGWCTGTCPPTRWTWSSARAAYTATRAT
jgi:hypothetical protein